VKRATRNKVEDILIDYPKVDKYIELREQELRYPISASDDNVGGGKSNVMDNDGTLRMLITIDDDRRLNALKRQRDIISEMLEEYDKDTVTIIREIYFKKRPEFTIDGLITNHLINTSHTTAFKLRKDFINDLAGKLGLYDLF